MNNNFSPSKEYLNHPEIACLSDQGKIQSLLFPLTPSPVKVSETKWMMSTVQPKRTFEWEDTDFYFYIEDLSCFIQKQICQRMKIGNKIYYPAMTVACSYHYLTQRNLIDSGFSAELENLVPGQPLDFSLKINHGLWDEIYQEFPITEDSFFVLVQINPI